MCRAFCRKQLVKKTEETLITAMEDLASCLHGRQESKAELLRTSAAKKVAKNYFNSLRSTCVIVAKDGEASGKQQF